MKRLAAAATLLVVLASGCVCPDTRDEVSRLRALHAEYRAATVPRPDLDAAKVDALGQRIDDAFAVLQQIEDDER